MLDFNSVDLNLLRVFQSIIDERSLTRASQRLGLSQPALSYSLGRLRALFDDQLFVRTTGGMLPTPIALQLRPPINRALASIREVLQHGNQFDPMSSSREFHLSMSDLGELVFLPLLCERLQREASEVKISAQQVPIGEVDERLRLGQLDFAIGNMPSLKASTRHAVLFREPYVCMTRKREGLPRCTLEREAFLAMSHVLVASSESSHLTVESSLQAAGLHRKIGLRVPHFTVVPQIILRTDWVVTLPQRVARLFNEHGGFEIYRLPVDTPEIEVTVHWHEAFDADQWNVWFRNLIIDTLREE
ncbi:LysR family transcriptional regulator [Paraburkholderia diazotrophica]|uniref:DNA-binding transcriptional regulator, LysR family n=1 Tax=Paraburkholderia diazotrophica TaxID=667676 RepID=A0A1H7CJ10_9BURK|nr:LysR family transcriptional regulator [Paraburkholderia diazotrophica]SEJ88587.1 DNA-binding transcriptional regulator, LysR family [Paraburkholderia diazotrophica]